jgi:hypothetical protein
MHGSEASGAAPSGQIACFSSGLRARQAKPERTLAITSRTPLISRSIATAIPVGAIATESCLPGLATAASAEAATPPPGEGERAPGFVLRLGADSTATSERSQCRAYRPSPMAARSSSPASATAPVLAVTTPNSAAMMLPRPLCRRERAGDTADGGRSSSCDRRELAAATSRALALPELCQCPFTK